MKKIIIGISALLFLFILVVIYYVKIYLPHSVGPYKGQIYSSFVTDSVDLFFDNKGIPQIFARSNKDLFYTLGWVHATERLFQMELMRKLVRGELSELLGDELLSLDKSIRKMRFYEFAKSSSFSLSDSLAPLLDAYLTGINERINNFHPLPPEFTILRHRPAPWTQDDCVAIYLFQTWFSHALMDQDSIFIWLQEQLGESLNGWLDFSFPWSPSTIQSQDVTFFPATMGIASNSVAVHKNHSKSGNALHESDPHLIVNQIPNFWYIAGLHSKQGLEFVGVTLPGLPFGIMGHTQNIAYSFTVASVDIIDYYRFPIVSQRPLQVQTFEGLKNVTEFIDTIQVKGKSPFIYHYYWIENMPVWRKDSTEIIAFRWAGFDMDPKEVFSNAFHLFYIKNFEQFRHTVTHLGALDANWVYSDKKGNIGYQLGTPVPIRGNYNTHLPQDGTNPRFQWKGYYPTDETPHVFNPRKGWLASCNNQIVPPQSKYSLPGFYDPYRITRAYALLSSKEKIDITDLLHFQQNEISGRALHWKTLLINSSKKLNNDFLLKIFLNWDGNMFPGSPAPFIYTYWWHLLPKFIFEDELGKDWQKARTILNLILEKKPEHIIDNKATPEKEDLIEISSQALDSAYHIYSKKKERNYSYFYPQHPMGRISILNYLFRFNRGPFISFGDGGTLNANWVFYNNKYHRMETIVGPSMRFLLDWSNIDEFSIYTNFGQSGNPYSPFYDSFLSLWRHGKTWVVPFHRNQIEKRSRYHLKIKPVDKNEGFNGTSS